MTTPPTGGADKRLLEALSAPRPLSWEFAASMAAASQEPVGAFLHAEGMHPLPAPEGAGAYPSR